MRLSLLLLVLIYATSIRGQQLDNLKEQDPLKLGGNISVGLSVYKATEGTNRRSPFAYYISASPVLSIYGFDIPVSFVYRDQKGSLSNPFQRFSITPTYKWITVGIGNTTVNLNPYTLSGQYFSGVYVQLTPAKFKFIAAYGILENPLAQIDTLISGGIILPSYKRKASAILIGYGTANNYFDLIAFRAKDDIGATDINTINKALIKPEENIVVGASMGFQFFKLVHLKANAAASAITSNQESNSDFIKDSTNSFLLKAQENFTVNLSSKLQFAGDAGLFFKWKKYGIGAEYKRVDPLYKSLGTYYFQEDYENITLKLYFNLLQNKIRFNGSGGIQKNNLNNLRAETRRRRIINATLTVMPTPSFSTTLRVSNFQSDRTPVLTTINDSLKFTQTTETYSIIPVYVISSQDKVTTISLMANYQRLLDLGLDLSGSRTVDNYTGNASYSTFFKPTDLGITLSALYNHNVIGEIQNSRLGGNLALSKKFYQKQLTAGINTGYNQNFINKAVDGNTITANINMRYQIKRKFSIGLNALYLKRSSDTNAFTEYRGTANFIYQFNITKRKTDNENL